MKATLISEWLQEVDQSIWDEDFEMQKKILVKIIDKTSSITTTLKLMMRTIKSHYPNQIMISIRVLWREMMVEKQEKERSLNSSMN